MTSQDILPSLLAPNGGRSKSNLTHGLVAGILRAGVLLFLPDQRSAMMFFSVLFILYNNNKSNVRKKKRRARAVRSDGSIMSGGQRESKHNIPI